VWLHRRECKSRPPLVVMVGSLRFVSNDFAERHLLFYKIYARVFAMIGAGEGDLDLRKG
jgi:hypothetical protein